MDIAALCHELEKSVDHQEWRVKLSDLIQIVKQRPRETRALCIAVSSVCNRALSIFDDDEVIRRRAVSCLCELAYDEMIVRLWDIHSDEVEALIRCLERGSEVVRSLSKEALARWVTPFPERIDPMVRFLIARVRDSPTRTSLDVIRNLVHLGTELLGGEERIDGDILFQKVVNTTIASDDDLESVHSALMMLHISEGENSERAPWIELSSHFMERRGALLDTVEHHASIQRIFFQECIVKFSFDVTLRLANMKLSGCQKLRVVLACLADHLEDFEVRMDTRGKVFCEETRQNVKLTPEKRLEVYTRMTTMLTTPLMVALTWAVASRIPPEMVEAQNKECYQLLEEKTRITAENHDQLEEIQELSYQCVAMAEKSAELAHHLMSALLINESQRFMHSEEIRHLHARLLTARRANLVGGMELAADFGSPSRPSRKLSTFM